MYERTRFGGIAIGDQVVVAVTHSSFLGQTGTVTRIIEADGEGTIFVRLASGSILPFGYSEVVAQGAFFSGGEVFRD